jgi:hypothetical protein
MCVCVECVGLCQCVVVCTHGFLICGCFGNMCTCIFGVLVLFPLGIYILICYWCKDYCHRVKIQLQ